MALEEIFEWMRRQAEDAAQVPSKNKLDIPDLGQLLRDDLDAMSETAEVEIRSTDDDE